MLDIVSGLTKVLQSSSDFREGIAHYFDELPAPGDIKSKIAEISGAIQSLHTPSVREADSYKVELVKRQLSKLKTQAEACALTDIEKIKIWSFLSFIKAPYSSKSTM